MGAHAIQPVDRSGNEPSGTFNLPPVPTSRSLSRRLSDALSSGRGETSQLPMDICLTDFPVSEDHHETVLETVRDTTSSIAARYEALLSVSMLIRAHHGIEGLFCALTKELQRVIDFDFIGIAQYCEG